MKNHLTNREAEVGYYPVSFNMSGRRCLVIGGGPVAERKIAALLEVGAAVTVISPQVTEQIAGWATLRSIEVLTKRYQAGEMAGFEIVFVATNDSQLNAAAYEEGKNRGIWVNVADDPAHCDFILPSVLRRGPLTVAVSTGGSAPALSRAIREELESYFTKDYEILAGLTAEVREELRLRSISPDYETWRKALGGDLRQLIAAGNLRRAKNILLQQLGATTCE